MEGYKKSVAELNQIEMMNKMMNQHHHHPMVMQSNPEAGNNTNTTEPAQNPIFKWVDITFSFLAQLQNATVGQSFENLPECVANGSFIYNQGQNIQKMYENQSYSEAG